MIQRAIANPSPFPAGPGAGAAPVEPFEDARLRVQGDAGAVVGYPNRDAVFVGTRRTLGGQLHVPTGAARA